MPQPAARPDYPNIPTAITRRESNLLAELTANRRVLEIGSYLGYSTVWMALHGAYVYAVDDHVWMDSGSQFRDNLARYGVRDRVEIWNIKSPEAASLIRQGFVDAVFVDGDHSYAQAAFDLRLGRRSLRAPGGWIVAHDYTFPGYCGNGYPEVIRAVDEVLGDLPEVKRAGVMYAARLDVPRLLAPVAG